MRFLPKKIVSRRQAYWLTVQVTFCVVLTSTVVTALVMQFIGKVIPEVYLFAFFVPLIFAPPPAYWLANLLCEITRIGQEIERIAYVDDLTGIANRRAFFEQAPDLIARMKDGQKSVSIILLDLDHFKNINDTYGHKAGDAMLILVADILTRSMRNCSGIVARLGGDEFVILAIHNNDNDILALADQIRSNVRNASIHTRKSVIFATVTIGLASHKAGADLDNTLLCADRALYLAKNAGRDRIAMLEADAA